MKKIINLLFPALLLPVLLSGCQGKNQTLRTSVNDTQALDSDTVSLTVWGAQEDEALLAELIDGFQKKYQNEAKFNITYTPQSESDCTNALMGDLEQSADVFAFADDQLNTLLPPARWNRWNSRKTSKHPICRKPSLQHRSTTRSMRFL